MKKALLTMTVLAASLAVEAQSIWNRAHLENVRISITSGDYRPALEFLTRQADSLLEATPLSVMLKKAVPARSVQT